MRRTPSRAFAALLLLAPLFGLGCSEEARTKAILERYETVFRVCKDETAKAGKAPGEHPCSTVASGAVDAGLEDSKLDEAKKQEMLSAWLEKQGYTSHYLPPEKRPQ